MTHSFPTRRSSDLTGGRTRFDVNLVQIVRLLRNGEPVKMSKRSGNFVTLADVVSEVGKDVVRFTMLTRKADAQMDFDFAKVVEASKDNPVRSEEHTSELQSLMRNSYAVFCLTKKNINNNNNNI